MPFFRVYILRLVSYYIRGLVFQGDLQIAPSVVETRECARRAAREEVLRTTLVR